MPVDREAYRNVHFFEALADESFGGCFQEDTFTERDILSILENILLVVEAPWTLECRDSGRVVTSTNNILSPGNYEVRSSGTCMFFLTSLKC